jgi:tetracycline resistance efflux pump
LLIESYPFLSLVPPLLAIILAVRTRQVYLSLFAGIAAGTVILADGHPLKGIAGAIEACVFVFKDPGNTRVIAFSVLVGSLIALLQRSGGIQGFTALVTEKGIIRGKKSVELTAFIIGVLIFIESSITCLITGTIARPLTDKYRISREKLAYICDSTSAPICSLIPLNAWGAYVITLLAKEGLSDTIGLFLSSLFLNFYAITALLLLLLTILFQYDFGPMRKAEDRARLTGEVLRKGAQPAIAEEVTRISPDSTTPARAVNLLVPVGVMVIAIVTGLYITGDGAITKGSGSTSVLWAVCSAILIAAVLYKSQNLMNLEEITGLFLKGAGGLIGLGALMMMAFAIGTICRELGTGVYIAGVTGGVLRPQLIPAVIFITTGFIAFSTGTSWGTWGIMFPIAIPIAQALDMSLPPVIGALLSGGVFGDHCSPISDTTIISSMASASDHIDHVRTQLPYALLAGAVSTLLFLITGIILY